MFSLAKPVGLLWTHTWLPGRADSQNARRELASIGLSGRCPSVRLGCCARRSYCFASRESPDLWDRFGTSTKAVWRREQVKEAKEKRLFQRAAIRRQKKMGQTRMSVPPATGIEFAGSLRLPFQFFNRANHAAPKARRCWKHSRQKTGRPCVGRKGTVVSLPHWEQVVFVSERIWGAPPPPPPPPSARLALQPLHLFGSFLKPLSAKNICSPAVKTNSALHSAHFSTLSWYSMSRSPLAQAVQGDGHISQRGPSDLIEPIVRGYRAGVPWACKCEAATETQHLCLTWV